jgi:hypothetical protein
VRGTKIRPRKKALNSLERRPLLYLLTNRWRQTAAQLLPPPPGWLLPTHLLTAAQLLLLLPLMSPKPPVFP